MKHNDGYYHFCDDLEAYPEAWCYIVWSKRGPGKTYSSLKYAKEENIPFIYMKRTIEDVELICSGSDKYGIDPSPYKPLNRDLGWNVKADSIKKGMGGFYEHTEENEAGGVPVGFLLALNAVKRFKGFDFSECEWILFDEFIPQAGEIIKRSEGEMLLDLYMTVARDRQKRGLPALKLILFANAEEISTPITNTLEVVDLMADLNSSGQTHYYDQERGILLHHITNEEVPIKDSEKTGIYAAMYNTAWGAKAFEGSFSNNDFSNVKRINLKGFIPLVELHHKNKFLYVYVNPNTGRYAVTSSKAKAPAVYDLNKENDQKRYWLEYGYRLKQACIDNMVDFQKYTYYDLLINYLKYFSL